MTNKKTALQVIESLRKGTPPKKGVELYGVGNEKLIEGIKKHHLSAIMDFGKIRFVNGSWGTGKTHFFRQLREVSFQYDCPVSTVQLNVDDAALNKFETIFASIIRNIAAPSNHSDDTDDGSFGFGTVLRESLAHLSTGNRSISKEISSAQFTAAKEALMTKEEIDIDFRKMVQKYWETFFLEIQDKAIIGQEKDEIRQWFTGEGKISDFKKKFGVVKIIDRTNAKIMLGSLAEFVKLSGYNGLVILFDEAEQSYSLMRQSSLKDAHNNLLTLINTIDELTGLFLIYATTFDFFTDPKYGIVIYGALAGRIGKPQDRPPRALDTIWNLDAVETSLESYQEAAKKILALYQCAYPETKEKLPSEDDISEKVAELLAMHSNLAEIRFWRLLVTAIVADLDDHSEGEPRETPQLYGDVMENLRDEV
ncbi:hypothetical protein FACS1894200_03770 [Spirochaetia bacterium]|nr:hypothetical protein FACS1894200_03770 [Spirochaetia bacterium]